MKVRKNILFGLELYLVEKTSLNIRWRICAVVHIALLSMLEITSLNLTP